MVAQVAVVLDRELVRLARAAQVSVAAMVALLRLLEQREAGRNPAAVVVELAAAHQAQAARAA
jgi:hypothetical protein